jgi:RNA polymerase sigma-70 factor, ECF subfamily
LSADRELIVRCRAGDPAAFAELAERHRAMIYRVALGIVRCPDTAEDIVQETLVRAYRSRARLDPGRDAGAWLRTIAANRALTACRREARGRGLVPALREEHADAGEADTSDGRVERALRMLSPMQRAVLTLFALDELTLPEAARSLGCSLGTTKKHLHRARERLRELLADPREEA